MTVHMTVCINIHQLLYYKASNIITQPYSHNEISDEVIHEENGCQYYCKSTWVPQEIQNRNSGGISDLHIASPTPSTYSHWLLQVLSGTSLHNVIICFTWLMLDKTRVIIIDASQNSLKVNWCLRWLLMLKCCRKMYEKWHLLGLISSSNRTWLNCCLNMISISYIPPPPHTSIGSDILSY